MDTRSPLQISIDRTKTIPGVKFSELFILDSIRRIASQTECIRTPRREKTAFAIRVAKEAIMNENIEKRNHFPLMNEGPGELRVSKTLCFV